MPEPNVNEEMSGKASEPELNKEEMAVKTILPEPKSKGKRLKKMIVKQSLKEKIVEPKKA